MGIVDDKCAALMQKVLKISLEQCLLEKYEESEVWDSLKHMELIVEFEKQFSVEFDENEMIEMTSLKNIVGIMKKKSLK